MSYESWLPECRSPYGYPAPISPLREPEPVDRPLATYAFDGGESPHSIMSPPRQEIEPWDEATRELRIVLHRHPVKPEFLQNTYKEAKKSHGVVRSCAVHVLRGIGDSQSIRVLMSLGFKKNETRSTGQGVCYTRDMAKPKSESQALEPKPEPKPQVLGWLERELKITTDAIEARRAIGVHETFLQGLLGEQAEQQKMVDEQRAARDAVKDTEGWKELCRQEREIQEQLDALKRGTCQP